MTQTSPAALKNNLLGIQKHSHSPKHLKDLQLAGSDCGCCLSALVCRRVALPAVKPAPAGAAAAGSPAASAPLPAVYGCTPNQSAPRPASGAAN